MRQNVVLVHGARKPRRTEATLTIGGEDVKKILYSAAIAALGVFVFGSGVYAQGDFPSKPIKYIIAFPPGGGSDTNSRILIPFLEKHLGPKAEIVPQNVRGAGGKVGWNELAAAKPDGYTIGMLNLEIMVVSTIDSKVRYKVDSFDMIGNINYDPTVIGVPTGSPYKTLKDLVTAAKAKPGKITVGIPTVGGAIGLLLFENLANVDFNVVLFGGGGPTRNALLGNHVPAIAMSMGALTQFKSKIHMLGQMAAERQPHGPWVPTFKSQGYDLSLGVHRSVGGPAGVPKATLAKLRSAMAKASADPEFKAAMTKRKLPVGYVDGPGLEKLKTDSYKAFSELWAREPWSVK